MLLPLYVSRITQKVVNEFSLIFFWEGQDMWLVNKQLDFSSDLAHDADSGIFKGIF